VRILRRRAVPGPGGLAPPTAGKASSCDDAVAQTAEPLRLPAVLTVTGVLEHEQAQPLRGPTIAGSHRREALVRPWVSRRRARRASRLPLLVAWHVCESQAGGHSSFEERATASSPSSSEHSVRLSTRLPCCELSVPTSPTLGPEAADAVNLSCDMVPAGGSVVTFLRQMEVDPPAGDRTLTAGTGPAQQAAAPGPAKAAWRRVQISRSGRRCSSRSPPCQDSRRSPRSR
jgi:hypothetical protein